MKYDQAPVEDKLNRMDFYSRYIVRYTPVTIQNERSKQ